MARYFVNANAIFETAPAGGGRSGMALRQVIARKPHLWHPGGKHTAQPVAEMGSMEWCDYRASIDVLLETAGRAALGCRIDPRMESSEAYGLEGYWLALSDRGQWELTMRDFDKTVRRLASGRIEGFAVGRWATLSIELRGNRITASIDGLAAASVTDDHIAAGNIAVATLASEVADFATPTDNYVTARFDNLKIE
jgi:hypothetical protein